MTNEDKELANSMWWWHRIKLTDDYTTPGHCPHGTGDDVETRFGLPKSLKGKDVLDIGAWDGLFSFEAEKRGANFVLAIDIYQTPKGDAINRSDSNKPFRLAKKILKSEVQFEFESLKSFGNWDDSNYLEQYDYILYFGVLYHVDEPLDAIKKLAKLVAPGGTILLETTITDIKTDKPILEYRPGFDDDITNRFYPNKQWVIEAFMQNGAKSVEQIWTDNHRASFRANF